MKFKIKEICNINPENMSKKDDYKFINYLDTSNITEGKIDEVKKLIIGKDKVPSRARRKVKRHDIIISTVRPNLKHYGIITNPLGNMIVSTGFAVLSPIEDMVNAKYLYYFLTQQKITNHLSAIAETSTTAYPSITADVLANIELDLPPRKIQDSISNLLSKIDEKIKKNNQINQTLEEMIHAIFKHWFSDFQFPNENEEPYKSSGGMFVQSDLGTIPEGWRIASVNEFITIKHGFAFKSKNFCDTPTDLKVLSPGNFKIGGGFKDDKFRYLQNEVDFPKEYILSENDLLLTMTDLSRNGDTLGYPAFIPYKKDGYYLHNQRLGKVIYREDTVSRFFLYCLFCTHDYRGHILGTATGTTVKHTAPKRIESYNFILPTQKLLEKFDEVVIPLFSYLSNINVDNNILVELFNTLHPKLMSGEIRIPDAEKEIEACL